MEIVHLVVKHRDDWAKAGQNAEQEMRSILPALGTFCRFVDDLHALFAKDSSKRAARRRRGRMVNNPSYENAHAGRWETRRIRSRSAMDSRLAHQQA